LTLVVSLNVKHQSKYAALILPKAVRLHAVTSNVPLMAVVGILLMTVRPAPHIVQEQPLVAQGNPVLTVHVPGALT
jgi:hypothetical protein